MHLKSTNPALEAKHLRRCMNDLVSVLALPAVWDGSEPIRVFDTLLDALMRMLQLDFLYARVRVDSQETPIAAFRAAPGFDKNMEEMSRVLNQLSEEELLRSSQQGLGQRIGHGASAYSVRMGVDGEVGFIVAVSLRRSFPEQTETLVLSVAANQAAIGLQQAIRLKEQKQVAIELDRRVAERTYELAKTNRQLQLQVELLQHLPVSTWTLRPDGTPDFVNQVWLNYSGQTLDFVLSRPEAWMEVIHPDDRERASRSFWEGVRTGKGFAIETRSLRAKDGTYRWHLQQAVPLCDAKGNVLRFAGTTTDIDDQKRAEEQLRASEGNLRRVIDTIPTLSWCNLPEGPNEFLSKGWHDYTGISPEEARGWGWQVSFHPDDLPPLMEKWKELLLSGNPGEIEARIRRHDGVYRWFLIRVAPFRDQAGSILRWYGTSTDIEDRQRAEDALRKSERSLVQIINTIPMLAWATRPDGYVEFVNQPWLDFTGLSAREAAGWGWSVVIHPEDASRLAEYWQAALGSGSRVEVEARMRRFDGRYRWFLFRAEPMRDESGAISKWYGVNTDIDDRKRAEEDLRIRELNLLQITETIPEMLWSASPDGAIEYCNGRFLDYTGFSLDQLLKDGWMGVLHPDDLEPTVEVWKSCVRSGNPYRVEVRTFHAADRTYRWCVTRALPLLDPQGRILRWHGTVVDMHDWKQSQVDLRNTEAELARMMRVMTIGQLTASVAHEVSQPLSGIVTNASTCLRMLNSNPPDIDGARATTQRTIRDGNRASEVITRLRTLFSKRHVDIEAFDLNEAAREVVALLSGELQANQINLKQELRPHLPLVNGDRIQLQQVILNLMRNASDAMSGVDDRPRRIVLKTELEGENVRLSVQDSGIGFAPEAAERIFEPFYTTKPEGMGVGLAVSRSIIDANQGRLWAAANDGPGATFVFSIPCEAGAQVSE